jgi:hypothetical protein
LEAGAGERFRCSQTCTARSPCSEGPRVGPHPRHAHRRAQQQRGPHRLACKVGPPPGTGQAAAVLPGTGRGDKPAKGAAEKSARDAGKAADKGDAADKGGTADEAAGKDKAKKDGTAGDAATGEKPKPPPALRGKVVKVDGDKLVIATGTKKNQKEVTVTADSATKVMIEGQAAKLADLKEGQQVAVTPAEGTPKRIAVPKPKADADKPAEAEKAGEKKPAEKAEKTENAPK